MVIVYARSGLGKTSLLQAGVAPRLREEDHLPLFVRVNDLRSGPFAGRPRDHTWRGGKTGHRICAGAAGSLWSFFKTAEFWRGDLLLTPVLVLDQFEELFTLQSEQARAHFLDQLSYLTRGVRPPAATPSAEELSEHPPHGADRAVPARRLSGLSRGGGRAHSADSDARFRLAPLDLHAAEERSSGLRPVRDPGLETRPFALDRQAVASILDYLSQRRTRIVGETQRYVEPFPASWSAGASSRSRPLDRPPRVPTSPSPWRIWAARPGSRGPCATSIARPSAAFRTTIAAAPPGACARST